MVKYLLIVLFTMLLVINYLFGFSIGRVSWNSMYPTLKNGDYFIYWKLPKYIPSLLAYNDIVVYSHYYDDAGKVNFVKRIICKPGDYAYTWSSWLYKCKKKSWQNINNMLKLEWYFLEGDNKKVSLDSRYCFSYGWCWKNPRWYEVMQNDIVGKVIFY